MHKLSYNHCLVIVLETIKAFLSLKLLKQSNIINTFLEGFFFFIVNTVFKKVKTIKYSFYEFIHLKNDTVNIGIFDHFQYNHFKSNSRWSMRELKLVKVISINLLLIYCFPYIFYFIYTCIVYLMMFIFNCKLIRFLKNLFRNWFIHFRPFYHCKPKKM